MYAKYHIILLIVLFPLLLNGFWSSSWKENGDVIVLNDRNFNSKTKEHDVLLIMFYVKWCSHCRRIHPDYEQAATKLSKHTNTPIYLAKYDCTNEAEAQCSEHYNVNQYPTLRIYRYGKFNNEKLNHLNRTTDEIVKTMRALKNINGSKEFISGQINGVKDEVNQATTNNSYMLLFIGTICWFLQIFRL
ncbi:hypothetical protein I4U23_019913 [Adineta vaga]|nr:hypothetical protein I4U23_019913 [Adineta vaga]